MINDGRTTWVYWLVDPRPALFRFPNPRAFYVGVSVHPGWRFHEHRTDRCSAAWARIREIERDGEHCKMELLREFVNRQDAFDFEYETVCRLPNLLNRDQRRYVHYQHRSAA